MKKLFPVLAVVVIAAAAIAIFAFKEVINGWKGIPPGFQQIRWK